MHPSKLLPCPFCGHDAPYFERTGTHRRSCIVACGMCGCRHESSDEGEESGKSWNERATQPTAEAAARDMQKRAAEAIRKLHVDAPDVRNEDFCLGKNEGYAECLEIILALPLNEQGKD